MARPDAASLPAGRARTPGLRGPIVVDADGWGAGPSDRTEVTIRRSKWLEAMLFLGFWVAVLPLPALAAVTGGAVLQACVLIMGWLLCIRGFCWARERREQIT